MTDGTAAVKTALTETWGEFADVLGDYILPVIGALVGLAIGSLLGLSGMIPAMGGGALTMAGSQTASSTSVWIAGYVLIAAAIYGILGAGFWKLGGAGKGVLRLVFRPVGAFFFGAAGSELLNWAVTKDVTDGPFATWGTSVNAWAKTSVGAGP